MPRYPKRPRYPQVKVGILALQGDVREHQRALSESGADPREIRRPGDLVGIDGIVLPGGESTTMSMLLQSSGLADPLGKELDAGLPVLGTCAGMILLAKQVIDGRPDQITFGAIDLAVRRNGYGRQAHSFESDVEVRGVEGPPLHAVFIRAPVVESYGSEVEVLATIDVPSDQTPIGVGVEVGAGAEKSNPIVCRQGQVLVCAFHPELTRDLRIHELFLSMIGSRRIDDIEDKKDRRHRRQRGR
ncbi:MAG TPA: pyridoxal 5'-phosphate synthase glutaminase subunit PdxT [Acidimicrobiales bacterium]|nr:pyridoxal 5'-phosphate synthase glutaminase subunit PdxT [Acidimicrobiales bacterium]